MGLDPKNITNKILFVHFSLIVCLPEGTNFNYWCQECYAKADATREHKADDFRNRVAIRLDPGEYMLKEINKVKEGRTKD